MSDFILVIILSVTMWFTQISMAYEIETKQEIEELKEVNSLLFGEGMATTARLKQCEKRKRR